MEKIISNPYIALLSGEGLLSLYPILIKKIGSDLNVQFWIRSIIYYVISYIFKPKREIEYNTSFLILSLINIVHIYTSYIAFSILQPGIAMTIFYTYPCMNILIAYLVLGEKFSMIDIISIVLSTLGVYMMYMYVKDNKSDDSYKYKVPEWISGLVKDKNKLGYISILVAALTESIMYLIVRSYRMNSWSVLNIMYMLPALLSIIMLMNKGIDFKLTSRNIIIIILSNLLIGSVGYYLRYYSAPLLSVFWFSILSLSGVLFSYLYGSIFTGEEISKTKIIGTILILGSVIMSKFL
jgi:drug/metabolite transporter (DMT)-like permease